MLIAVDVGNTGAKAGVFRGPDLLRVERFRSADLAAPADLARLLGRDPGEIDAVVVVSVSANGLAEFEAGPGRSALVLGRDVPISVSNHYRDPTEVGADRLVNAAAAHANAKGAVIAADLGSAVTVDAISATGAFLGGAIAPGAPALRAGLRSAAPALPEWGGGEPGPALPTSTDEAIRFGIVHGLAGLVDGLIDAVGREFPAPVPVLLTGGDAPLVAGLLRHPVSHLPHLTLEGVRLLYDLARRDRPCT
jgi:type III pantothenate kinase